MDVAVVGAGIVGLATARAILLAQNGLTVVVLEKSFTLAAHQSGHNSGVIHAGVYYRPGSDKARLSTAGRLSMLRYCQEKEIAHRVCGKVVVAVDATESPALHRLHDRCVANGVTATLIGSAQLAEIEPNAAGVEALHVPGTAVVDYRQVCLALADDVTALGGRIHLDVAVTAGSTNGAAVYLETTTGPLVAKRVVTCAGLQADQVARAVSGPDGDAGLRIIGFRGEYHQLPAVRASLVQALIYPVPNERFPFLGVHLTRGIDGQVHAGPNAILALAREGYGWRQVEFGYLRNLLGYAGFRRMIAEHWRYGVTEMARALSRRRCAAALRRLVPEITTADLQPSAGGVRAQAVASNGRLVDDFVFHRVGRAVHVLNAPSPAATAALEIGQRVAASVS